MNEEDAKKKRILYCPQCSSDMFNLFDLIDHVKNDNCGMTVERLVAVGVLDEGEVPSKLLAL